MLSARKTKIIAYYLPQYHEIPENNEWWGKGFTEWTNVKNAKPVFKGHIQPKIPMDNNYYDLTDKKTIEWQTELSHKYGIYGFCYFHYYFKDGKKILEKPAENLLKWKDINQKFCFFWANSQWQRTWSAVRVGGTTWIPEDCKTVGDNKEVLLEQDYGNEKDWEEHFNYCLQFFQDERYIKIENKPFFAIYQMNLIDCAEDMMAVWNKLAKQHGFDGIHFVSVNQACPDNKYVEAVLQYGGFTFQTFHFITLNFIRRCINVAFKILHIETIKNIWDYEFIWRCIIKRKPIGRVQNYPGGTVKYDETPRRAKKALVFKNESPRIFEKYLKIQMLRAKDVYHSEYLFLDAWNEWGEGNYLEPDEENGYSFLESLKNVVDGDF